MSRYIDADKLMNEIDKLKKSPWYNEDFGISAIRLARHDGLEIVVDLCIKRAPTADVQELRHGKWKRTDDGAAYCTACKRKMNPHCYGYACCPVCGAKMDGKEDKQ